MASKDLSPLEQDNVDFLKGKQIPFVTVRLSGNALKHSLFDATVPIRTFLKENGIHDYESQGRGEKNKVCVKTHILNFMADIDSQTTLNRAMARGDKRMWLGSAIFKSAAEDDLLVMMAKGGELYVINITKQNLYKCYLSSMGNPIKTFLRSYN